MTDQSPKINEIVTKFAIPGKLLDVVPLKRGHINQTFISRWQENGGQVHEYVHQWINNHVFKDVPGLMKNIEIVTKHVGERIKKDSSDKTLEIVPAADGVSFTVDSQGEYWRTYRRVLDATSFEVCTGLAQAREAAATMGRFHRYLADLQPTELVETIPYFHHTPRRFDAFEQRIREDRVKRAQSVAAEIDFARERQGCGSMIVEQLSAGTLPLRVTHNDMKLNNVLFSNKSGEGICLVDLDTVMGGSYLYDFGDLARNVSVPADEDEVDLSRVEVDLKAFEAILAGYAEAIRGDLSREEIELLVFAPRIMALTLGVRFLSDHLDGDRYFRIHKPDHNLIRARSQFKVVASFERNEAAIRGLIKSHFLS